MVDGCVAAVVEDGAITLDDVAAYTMPADTQKKPHNTTNSVVYENIWNRWRCTMCFFISQKNSST